MQRRRKARTRDWNSSILSRSRTEELSRCPQQGYNFSSKGAIWPISTEKLQTKYFIKHNSPQSFSKKTQMLPWGDMDHYDAWLVAVCYSGIIASYCLSNFGQCFSSSGRNYSPPTLKDLTGSSRAGCGATSHQSLATENSQLLFSLFVPAKSH